MTLRGLLVAQSMHTLHAETPEIAMATLTIRNVDPEVQKRLRVRAAQNGRSTEAELRQIIQGAVQYRRRTEEGNLAEAIRRIFAPLGGVELEPPPRIGGLPPEFGE